MATIAQLEKGVQAAYDAGNMEYARILGAELVRARKDTASNIPGTQAQGTATAAPETGIGDTLAGAAEAALTLGTGAVAGLIGAPVGMVRGLGSQIVHGTMGTQQGVQDTQKFVSDAMQAMTYQPRTQSGQEMVGAIGQVAQKLPPFIPMIGQAGMIGQAARDAMPMAIATGQRVAQPVQQAAQKAAQAVGRVPGKMKDAVIGIKSEDAGSTVRGGSIGAAATPIELQRAAEAEMANLRLSEAEIKRSPQLLAQQAEWSKTPEFQAPFLARQQENNRNALLKLDTLIDDTGAETGTVSDTGVKVVDALMKGWKEEKAKTRALYEVFRQSPEAQLPVNTGGVIDFLNSQPVGIAGRTGISDEARHNMVQFGLATRDSNGKLTQTPTTLGQLEDLRQTVGAMKSASPTDARMITILKQAIDEAGGPVGAAATKAMRAQRARQAAKFENRAVVSRLLLEKKGFTDPQTPIEDVFAKSILSARPSEITHLKRVLMVSGGEDGRQAWKELQGATLRHLQDSAVAGIGSDNLPVISAAKLDKALQSMDKNGKLDLVLGVQNAEQVRNLNQVLKYIQSTPPLTSINNSGTARTLMSLLVEAGSMGVLTGFPFPVIQTLKMIRDNAKDNHIKARIDAMLNYKPNTGAQP